MYEQNQVVPDLASAINLLEMQRLQLNQLNGVIEDMRLSLVERDNRLERATLIAESYKAKRDAIVSFIQKSIDNGDWEQSELQEIFWEELAEIADLDLKRTKEVEFKITISYYGSVTVPYDCDVESDLEVEGVPSDLEFSYKGEVIDEQTCNWDEQVIEAQ